MLFLSFLSLFAKTKILYVNLESNTSPYQLIISVLILVTRNDLVYLKKIGNYQQKFYVITKNNG